MNKEEQNRRRTDDRVKYIAKNICRFDTGKPYVFISYKSDEWGTVLGEIVYKLVKEHGLNVYFDADFNKHNALWTEQFRVNMESEYCKGVLAFVDDIYSTSYATLMELLYSQLGCYREKAPYDLIKKPVITINLGKFTLITDESDTGLGASYFENGEQNIHYTDELNLFKELFDKAKDEKLIVKTVRPYEKSKKLSKALCAEMCKEVLGKLGTNDNHYNEGIELDDIVETIKSQCGDQVFCPIKDSKNYRDVSFSDDFAFGQYDEINPFAAQDPFSCSFDFDDAFGESINLSQSTNVIDNGSKRKPGRPKGSKNKNTFETDNLLIQQEKRKPGRPKGSKNKSKFNSGEGINGFGSDFDDIDWNGFGVDDNDSSLDGDNYNFDFGGVNTFSDEDPFLENLISNGVFDEKTKLSEFARICEDVDFCMELRKVRKEKGILAQIFDYFMASLLGGCDGAIVKKGVIIRRAPYNYCKFVVAQNIDRDTIDLGASQYTWESNSRKALRFEDIPEYYIASNGRVKSGTLGEYSDIFERLSPNTTIGEVLLKYKKQEKGFNTKDNEMIFKSWNLIKGLSK